MRLDQEKCVPCLGREPPLRPEQIKEYLPQVPQWEVRERDGIDTLERTFRFRDFASALAFTDRVGAEAESEGHHPSILTEWGRVRVTWWTHSIKGLHRNDFIMAARSDRLYQKAPGARLEQADPAGLRDQ
jgi:4a-hydroxytetrahydrobiopterin dehydratase